MRVYLFLDYDGTLTPIRSAPEKAVLSRRGRMILKELSALPAVRTVIVTGRSLKNIKKTVGLKNLVYAGNHGLEIEGPGIGRRVLAGNECRKAIALLSRRLRTELSSVKGILVENKGLTASLHYRRVSPQVLPGALSAFNRITGPLRKKKMIRTDPGKKVLEIKPAVDWDKGKAVLWIMKKLGAGYPVYIGDDVTDEAAFKALSKKGLTVFVGESGDTKARYRLKGPRQVLAFLNGIREVCRDGK